MNIFVEVISSGNEHAYGMALSRFQFSQSVYLKETSGLFTTDDRVNASLRAIQDGLALCAPDKPRTIIICSRDAAFINEMIRLSPVGEAGLQIALAASSCPGKDTFLALL